MACEINLTPTAADHVRTFRKFEQRIILDAIEKQLKHEPTTETGNRKRLDENELSDWELRVERFRVFYDVVADDDHQVVRIKAVGHKEHNKLTIGGKEIQL
jgi:mRNA-degrading endonuclease RelE of RelBE toxin-antitoxin system